MYFSFYHDPPPEGAGGEGEPMQFYPGLHQPSDCSHFPRSFVSINRLLKRKGDFPVNEWILDSGAFSQLAKTNRMTIEEAAATDQGYPVTVAEHASQIQRWSQCGTLVAACAQDYMCEQEMFPIDPETDEPLSFEDAWRMNETRGISIEDHQHRTVDRYAHLTNEMHRIGCDTPIMAVIQGYSPEDYLRCLDLYENKWDQPLLEHGAYVGVGSICKRNTNSDTIHEVLTTINAARPDLQLHGFGLKITALTDPRVRSLLKSGDSMAWSFAARRQGRDQNDWREAKHFANRVERLIADPTVTPQRAEDRTPQLQLTY